jgi:hypothetical protein
MNGSLTVNFRPYSSLQPEALVEGSIPLKSFATPIHAAIALAPLADR